MFQYKHLFNFTFFVHTILAFTNNNSVIVVENYLFFNLAYRSIHPTTVF